MEKERGKGVSTGGREIEWGNVGGGRQREKEIVWWMVRQMGENGQISTSSQPLTPLRAV